MTTPAGSSSPARPYDPGTPTRWLSLAILAALACAPFGIAGVVFALLAQSAQKRGDRAAEQRHVRTAKIITLIGLGLGAALLALGFLLTAMEPSAEA